MTIDKDPLSKKSQNVMKMSEVGFLKNNGWMTIIFRYFSSMTDSRMVNASILAVFVHTCVNMTEYSYVSEIFV